MEQKIKSKKLLFTVIIFVLLAFMAGAGIIFGYLSQSVVRSFETVIKSTNVTFKFNDMTYIDEIANEKIDLYKGAKTDVLMKIEVIGSRKVVVEYEVSFIAEIKGEQADALMSAIEIYRRHGSGENARREYLGRLNQIEDITIGGIMVTAEYRNDEIPLEEIPLEFVFSSAASDDYYKLIEKLNASEEAAFSVKARASAVVSNESEKYVFASNSEEFEERFKDAANVGKTIILAGTDNAQDNNYITLDSDLTSSGIVGIDLNGRNLKLNNHTLTINNNTTGNPEGLYPNYGRLGITDNKGTGIISGNGYISIENAKDAFLIDSRLTSNLETGTVRLSSSKNDYSSIFDDYIQLLSRRAEKLNDGTVYKNGDDVSFLFDNLHIYYQSGIFAMTQADVNESAIVYNNVSDKFLIANSGELTSKYWYTFYFYNSALIKNKVFSGYVTIRGNSPKAIADSLNAEIPFSIKSSQFFRTYDSVTGAHIEWYVDDSMGGRLLDNRGVYRKNGLSGIFGELGNLYPDKEITIFIKVAKGNDGGGSLADTDDNNNGLFAYTHSAETVSAKERTALVFNDTPVIIPVDGIFDINKDYLEAGFKDVVSLVGIKIDNVDDDKGYIKVNNTGANADFNTVSVRPDVTVPQNTLTDVTFDITFIYKVKTFNAAGAVTEELRECKVNKLITIEGEYSEVTKYDMSYTLQIAFSSNDYTEGKSNVFYGYGALRPLVNGISVPVLCDYTVQGVPAKYISIRYAFISVEDLGGTVNEQLAYFTKNGNVYEYINDPKSVNDNTSEHYGKQLYERKAVIEVLYARITTVDEIIAYFTVSCYTLDWANGQYTDPSGNLIKGTPNYGYIDEESGSLIECPPGTAGSFKIYKDPTSGNTRRLNYNVSLQIVGIIRNNSTQVADLQLYNVYLNLFDANGDGIITNKEAENWNGVKQRFGGGTSPYLKSYTSQLNGTVYYYIDLSGLTITGLKGVEYFRGVEGYNFDSTGRGNLSALAPLNNLVYLSFRSNSITDLSALQYLDKLEYLDFYNNKITNIDPLRNLPNLTYLSFESSATTGYNTVSNYEPLTLMTKLKTLNLKGMRTTNSTGLHADGVTMYYFAILTINCPGISFTYDFTINVTNEMIVAAKVMRDLENINRVNKTLLMPTFYDYENAAGTVTKYQLYWYVDKDETNLYLYYQNDDPTANPVVKYTIISPIQDKPVKLYLKVFKTAGSAESYDISREFNLTLEASYSGEKAYIYDYIANNGTYLLAEEAIPDVKLRTRLFEMFNKNVIGEVTGFAGHSELYTISKKDFDYYYDNYSTVYDLSYRGIQDLSGIKYFFRVLKGELNLSGNPFPSKELSKLTNLDNTTSLILGGARYEFRDLLDAGGALIPSAITTLYVSECYGLDEESVLSSLYRVYLSKSGLNLYVETATTAWDPYAKTLPAVISKLKTTASFAKRGDTYNIYTANGGTTGIPFEIYGISYILTISSGSLYYYSTNQTMNTSGFVNYSTGVVTYYNSFGSELTATARFTPQFSERRGTTTANKSFNYYYMQFIFADGGDYIDVYEDGNTGKYLGTLSEVLAPYDLKTTAYTRLYTYISNNWNSATLKVTDRSLLAGNPGRFSIDSNYSGTFADYKGRIAVSTLIFGASYAMSGQSTTLTLSTYQNKTASKEGSLAGLQYFPGITTLNIYADVDFGNGAGLKNITTLSLNRMAVDFTTINIKAEKLTSITLNYFYFFDAGTAANSAFQYFPNLQALDIMSYSQHTYLGTTANTSRYWINDFSFLKGLINSEGKSSLTRVRIYNYTGSGTTASIMPTSDENAKIVKSVYVAALKKGYEDYGLDPDYYANSYMQYRIGSPILQSDSGYFYAIYKEGKVPAVYDDLDNWVSWYSPTNSISAVTNAWGGASKSSILDTTAAAYNFSLITGTGYMKDMGLRYNEPGKAAVYWVDDEKRTTAVSWTDKDGITQSNNEYVTVLAAESAIYLPASTASLYYGLIFGKDITAVAANRDFRIKWDIFINTPSTAKELFLTYNGSADDSAAIGGTDVSSLTGFFEIVTEHNNKYLKITFKDEYKDAYVSVIGTLISSSIVTIPYSYWYELKIGEGDGVYTYNKDKYDINNNKGSGVRDMALRMWLFANRNTYKDSAAANISITVSTTGSYNSELRRSSLYSVMGYTNVLLIDAGTGTSTSSTRDHVKSVYGICDVFDYWKITAKINSFTLQFGKFKDISPLYRLENLITLNLSSSLNNSSTYYRSNVIIDNSIAGKFLKLGTLNLSYCSSITPESLSYLALTARPNLATLNLYYTRCMYNYESIEYIRKIIDYKATKSIILVLNNSVTTDTVTVDMIDDFSTWMNPVKDYPNGFNPDYTLYKAGTESFTKSLRNATGAYGNVKYSYTISAATQNLIKNYLVASKLDIRLQITFDTTISLVYRQFTGIYTPDGSLTFYNVAVTSDLRFGVAVTGLSTTAGLTAAYFDTELLAYMFNDGTIKTYFVQNSYGSYVYNTTSNTSAIGSSFLRGFKKTVGGTVYDAAILLKGNTGNILLNTTYYLPDYALSYKESLIAEISTSYTNVLNSTFVAPDNYTTLLYNLVTAGTSSTITYMTGSQPEYTAMLPNYLYYKGSACAIEWGLGNGPSGAAATRTFGTRVLEKNPHEITEAEIQETDRPGDTNPLTNTSLQKENKLLYKDLNGYIYFILNSTTLPANNLGEFTGSFYIYTSLMPTGGALTNTAKQITLASRGANVTTSYNKYIEAKVEGGYVKLMRTDGTTYYTVGLASQIPYEPVYKSGTLYFNEQDEGKTRTSDTVIIKSSYVFDSPWLTEYLYVNYFTTVITRNDKVQHGYIMTPAMIAGLTSIDIKYNTGMGTSTYPYASYARFVSSIEGVQIFYNLKSFIARTGMFTDLSPLANLSLTTFYYSPISEYTTGTNTNGPNPYTYNYAPHVTDFTPLLAASKDTLKYFSYNGGGMAQMLDMNFLLGLTALEEVYISSAYFYSYVLYSGGTSYTTYGYGYNGLSYFMTSSGRYLINALASRKDPITGAPKPVYIFTDIIATSAFGYANSYFKGNGRSALTYNASISRATNYVNNIAGHTTVYALTASINDGFAYSVLSGFKSDIPGVSYKDGYVLEVNTGSPGISFSAQNYADTGYVLSSVTFDISSTIIQNGGFYIIDWESAGANTIINKYYLTRDLTVEGVTYAAGQALSSKDLDVIANSIEYYSDYRAGLIQLKTSVTVLLDNNLYTVSNARITGSIELNDYNYGRMFTFSFI